MPDAQIPARKPKATSWKQASKTAQFDSECPRCCGDILAGQAIIRQGTRYVCGACAKLN